MRFYLCIVVKARISINSYLRMKWKSLDSKKIAQKVFSQLEVWCSDMHDDPTEDEMKGL